MNSSPIGIYDSGFGGLTIWRAIRERLPSEELIYLGDGKNCPYGSRTKEQITQLAECAVERLLSLRCKMVVVACNTATAAAIDHLRERYANVDIVGLEPAIKPACLLTRSGVVGVLATERSLEGDLFQHTAAKYGSNVRVIASFGRGFVEIVEGDLEDTECAEEVVRTVVDPMVEAGVDQIVLGCTHYPFLIPLLKRIAPMANIIDPSPAVAKRVEQLLERRDALAEVGRKGESRFITFADESYRERLEAKAKGMAK